MVMHLSVIIPSYCCEVYISELTFRLHRSIQTITSDYEIIFVNDGSPKRDWEIIQTACQADHRVKGISLSRNFGQHYAITSGLDHSSGEWIVVMDGDLQDQPEEIPKLYEMALSGFDIVCAQRVIRKDSLYKRMVSKFFYSLFSYLTSTTQDPTIANFGIYSRKVISSILSMGDVIRYFPAMVQWVGFPSTVIPVVHAKRKNGSSTYHFGSLLDLAFNNMIAFSEKPLWIAIGFGFLLSSFFALVGITYVCMFLSGSITVSGFVSLILTLWFLSGIIIFVLGVIGLYIGKIFQVVKNRPLYIIDQKVNLS